MAIPTPTPNLETLDDVVPRLTACMGEVISRLEGTGVKVETVETYLLDSSEHKLRVPCALDGVPIQMSFSASMPAWSERVRAHLQVLFGGGRRWSVYEAPNGFNVKRIVARIKEELDFRKQEHDKWLDETRKRRLAEERLAALSVEIDVACLDPLTLRQDNVEVVALPDSPMRVRVTVQTDHADAARIVQEFRRVSRPRKKE